MKEVAMSHDEHVVERFTVEGLDVKIIVDYDTENPYKDWEQMSTLLTWHRSYSFSDDKWEDWDIYYDRLGDGHYWASFEDYDTDEGVVEYPLYTPTDMAEYLQKRWGAEVMGVELHDHSYQTVNTIDYEGRTRTGWDSGMCGLVFIPERKILTDLSPYRPGRRYIPGERLIVTEGDRARARETIKSEINTLDMYLTSQVYGYVIDGVDPDVHESLWSIYGLDHAMEYAREEATRLWEEHKDDENPFDPREQAA